MIPADSMILEGIVTTLGDSDDKESVNISPMGPLVTRKMDSLLLRPYTSSRTYQNLAKRREGVFHVVDDVELLARAAVSKVSVPLEPAGVIEGFRLRDCCRAYEFRVISLDDSQERTSIEAEVVHTERVRDFFGLHRARHAVLEAAILATRTEFLPVDDILSQLDDLRVLVDKTGSAAEHRAFDFLREFVEAAQQSRSVTR